MAKKKTKEEQLARVRAMAGEAFSDLDKSIKRRRKRVREKETSPADNKLEISKATKEAIGRGKGKIDSTKIDSTKIDSSKIDDQFVGFINNRPVNYKSEDAQKTDRQVLNTWTALTGWGGIGKVRRMLKDKKMDPKHPAAIQLGKLDSLLSRQEELRK